MARSKYCGSLDPAYLLVYAYDLKQRPYTRLDAPQQQFGFAVHEHVRGCSSCGERLSEIVSEAEELASRGGVRGRALAQFRRNQEYLDWVLGRLDDDFADVDDERVV